MATPSLASLLIRETKERIYATAIGVAQSIGLPVSSWQPGDPTRSLFHVEAEILSTLEDVVAGFISSRFLGSAHGDWLKLEAKQTYNVDVPPATSASTGVVLTNNGGGYYPDIDPGDLTFRNSLTGKTYTSTTGGILASGPGTTLTVTVVADDAGAAGSAGPGEIDELVTGLLGVTCTNPLAAVGIDEQDESVTVQQCLDKLGSFSPDGPREAYRYVARNAAITGTNGVTRVRSYASESDGGVVLVYLAGPSGGVSEPDRVLVEVAILKWATPLCITPLVYSATNVAVPITYELWVYKSANKTEAEVRAAVLVSLGKMLASREIGGDIIAAPPISTGAIYKSLIESTIRSTFPHAFRVAVTAPTGDVQLTNGQVAVLGTVTAVVHLVVDP